MKMIFGFAVFAVLAVSSTASAQLATRCFQDDQLVNTTLSQGRNAWAFKCGYISANKQAFLNEEGEYQVFANGCYAYPNVPAGSSCTFHVPADGNAACVGGLVKLGTCVAGCYTPQEELSFDGKYWAISEAYASGVRTVSALSRDATLDAPITAEQAIATFVAGDTVEDVFAIETVDGRKIEVTSEHPLVDGEGVMVKAKTLREGDFLLSVTGDQIEIARITVFRYEGKVWNVRPLSKEKIENVLDVEGLLTGSVRFQNEWADDHFRLSLRDEADVSGL